MLFPDLWQLRKGLPPRAQEEFDALSDDEKHTIAHLNPAHMRCAAISAFASGCRGPTAASGFELGGDKAARAAMRLALRIAMMIDALLRKGVELSEELIMAAQNHEAWAIDELERLCRLHLTPEELAELNTEGHDAWRKRLDERMEAAKVSAAEAGPAQAAAAGSLTDASGRPMEREAIAAEVEMARQRRMSLTRRQAAGELTPEEEAELQEVGMRLTLLGQASIEADGSTADEGSAEAASGVAGDGSGAMRAGYGATSPRRPVASERAAGRAGGGAGTRSSVLSSSPRRQGPSSPADGRGDDDGHGDGGGRSGLAADGDGNGTDGRAGLPPIEQGRARRERAGHAAGGRGGRGSRGARQIVDESRGSGDERGVAYREAARRSQSSCRVISSQHPLDENTAMGAGGGAGGATWAGDGRATAASQRARALEDPLEAWLAQLKRLPALPGAGCRARSNDSEAARQARRRNRQEKLMGLASTGMLASSAWYEVHETAAIESMSGGRQRVGFSVEAGVARVHEEPLSKRTPGGVEYVEAPKRVLEPTPPPAAAREAAAAGTRRDKIVQSFRRASSRKAKGGSNATAAAGNGARLPTGWKEQLDPDGQVYYYHVSTRQTQWTRPTEELADQGELLSQPRRGRTLRLKDVDPAKAGTY